MMQSGCKIPLDNPRQTRHDLTRTTQNTMTQLSTEVPFEPLAWGVHPLNWLMASEPDDELDELDESDELVDCEDGECDECTDPDCACDCHEDEDDDTLEDDSDEDEAESETEDEIDEEFEDED